MKQTKQYILTIGFITSLLLGLYGQGGTEVFEANNNLKRTISPSEKIATPPQLSDTTMEIPPVKYYIEPTYVEVDFETKPIKPAKIKVKEPLEKLYKGYLKAGLGTYTRPYLDLYYNSLRSKKKIWGINLKHHSSLTNLKNVGYNRFSDNKISGFYEYIFNKKTTFYNTLTYERNKFNYYGFSNADTLIPEGYRTTNDSTKQVYQTINYRAELRQIQKDSSKFSHTTNMDFYYLNGLTKINEINITVASNFYKYIGQEEVGADVSLGINHLKQPVFYPLGITPLPPVLTETKFGNTVIKVNPFIKTRRGNLLAKVGVGIHGEFTNITRFYFYPDLKVSYSLFNNIFVPYLGTTGGLNQNTFNTIRQENPFVLENIRTLYRNENIAYRNTNQRILFYGGFKGSISSTVSFNLKAQFQKTGNQILFVNDTLFSYENKFNVVYDSIDQTTLSAQIGYQLNEKIKIYTQGEYYNYSTLNQEYAWMLPNYRLSILGVYDLADKIIARLNIQLIGDRKAYSLRPIEGVTPNAEGKYIYTLNPYVDANIGLEYRYNKRLSAFIDFNNIVGQKYQRWANYPVYTFNLLGGVTYSF